jgi:hypothetical protein
MHVTEIWFLSGVDLDHKGSTQNLTMNRRYLDPNRVTYEVRNIATLGSFPKRIPRQYHTHRRNSSFDTSQGREITAGLEALAARFNLSDQFGTAPQDYTLSRDPYPSTGSLLSLMATQVLPTALAINNTRNNISNIIITNSGGLRFDIYKGPFTKNDQLTASPFTNAFLYIADVPLGVASAVLPALNGEGANSRRDLADAGRYARGDVEMRYRQWLEGMYARAGPERRAAQNLTLGYVTEDVSPHPHSHHALQKLIYHCFF